MSRFQSRGRKWKTPVWECVALPLRSRGGALSTERKSLGVAVPSSLTSHCLCPHFGDRQLLVTAICCPWPYVGLRKVQGVERDTDLFAFVRNDISRKFPYFIVDVFLRYSDTFSKTDWAIHIFHQEILRRIQTKHLHRNGKILINVLSFTYLYFHLNANGLSIVLWDSLCSPPSYPEWRSF